MSPSGSDNKKQKGWETKREKAKSNVDLCKGSVSFKFENFQIKKL